MSGEKLLRLISGATCYYSTGIGENGKASLVGLAEGHKGRGKRSELSLLLLQSASALAHYLVTPHPDKPYFPVVLDLVWTTCKDMQT